MQNKIKITRRIFVLLSPDEWQRVVLVDNDSTLISASIFRTKSAELNRVKSSAKALMIKIQERQDTGHFC
jgi:hypothetical protein